MMLTSSNMDSGFDSGSSPEMQNVLLHAASTASTTSDVQSMSRTHQYRKVMKPLLERKRRARINKCLDELKDLMVTAMQTEGESITKLEKADVLELTVRHLRKLKRQNALGLTPQATYAGKFKSGYAHCAQEVSKFMSESPGLDVHVSTRLLSHLSNCIQTLEVVPPSGLTLPPQVSPGPISPQSLPPTSSATMSKESCNEDEALDLSSNLRKRASEAIESFRDRRKSSNDSSEDAASNGSKEDDKSWRPW